MGLFCCKKEKGPLAQSYILDSGLVRLAICGVRANVIRLATLLF
nr:MAG TPA: hypothetical protein [Caudoviricetes sp.]